MNHADPIFELSELSEEIEKIRKRLDSLENRVELIEASYVSIVDLQKQVERIASELRRPQAQKHAAELNALADSLCRLMQQIGELVDKVIGMWREVVDECRS
jgi:chromosome segregation ATPase